MSNLVRLPFYQLKISVGMLVVKKAKVLAKAELKEQTTV